MDAKTFVFVENPRNRNDSCQKIERKVYINQQNFESDIQVLITHSNFSSLIIEYYRCILYPCTVHLLPFIKEQSMFIRVNRMFSSGFQISITQI